MTTSTTITLGEPVDPVVKKYEAQIKRLIKYIGNLCDNGEFGTAETASKILVQLEEALAMRRNSMSPCVSYPTPFIMREPYVDDPPLDLHPDITWTNDTVPDIELK